MIGWILLSRKAVASAEQALNDQQQGVRDEIGFLALHQAFADRFFPGTSVLHTRLRYTMFVPWLLERSRGSISHFQNDLLQLTEQLRRPKSEPPLDGVIGGTIWPREPAQSPAMIYWGALSRWGILQPRLDKSTPTRGQVLQRLALIERSGTTAQRTLDGEPLWSADLSPFVNLPAAPADLLRTGRIMDFKLTLAERRFLRRHLMAVPRPDDGPSLLARLAETGVSVAEAGSAWHTAVHHVADASDRYYLTLAEHASALAGIGRAVYSSLVEQAKNRDTKDKCRTYSDDLMRMRALHEASARSLDIPALRSALPVLPGSLMHILGETQKWLRGSQDCSVLAETYQRAEFERKGTRARLGTTLGAKERRSEWNTLGMPHPLAETLHYRWFRVRTLLNDLGAT